MANESIWQAPLLSAEDQRLISTYKEVGRPVDELAYSDAFEELMKRLGKEEATMDDKRAVYQRLLYLRKSGRLPRVYK